MDVLSLLDSKKKCLRRLLDRTEAFVAAAESGDLTGLEAYERERVAVFKALDLFDRKITETVRAIPGERRDAALSRAVEGRLAEEAMLVRLVLRADNKIMAAIEREQARLRAEIATSQKSKELAGKFKSGAIREPGEGLDQNV
jgi:hypothetical protein